jgi:dienelactone hydrolase
VIKMRAAGQSPRDRIISLVSCSASSSNLIELTRSRDHYSGIAYRENPTVIRLFRIVRFAIACGFWLGAGSASAGALVEFPNVSDKGPTLAGYLARPDVGLSAIAGGTAVSGPPYAAVVVLHGCGGISSHSIAIADRLGSWGYVALTVDSLGPRGIANACGGSVGASQAFDAYAAFRYLAAQDFVDPKRIAVLGQSMGGIAALYGVDCDMAAQYFTERFRAAIAYYPKPDKPEPNRRFRRRSALGHTGIFG